MHNPQTGKILQVKEALNEIVKDLLRLPLAEQPDDFQELHTLIAKRIKL